MADSVPPELSVVVPVYGCENCLRALHRRLRASIAPITSEFELIFVDDRSPDGAWETIVDLARADTSVRGFRLSRNFGQDAAITAGLAQTRGRWTVVMDGDLEEPPEEIPRLYAKAEEGYDVVQTTRRHRHQSRVRQLVAKAYVRLRNSLTGTTNGTAEGTLSILSWKAVDAFLRVRDTHREYRLLVGWLGFRRATIEFAPEKRHAGKSSYTLSRLARVAVDGMFFQTTVLLRWVVVLGFFVASIGLLLAAYMVYDYIAHVSVPGYTSLVVLLLVLTGFIIVSLGVVGLYVGKVFEQVKERPLFLIDSEVQDGVDLDVQDHLASTSRGNRVVPVRGE